jgi:perosamine synthetase
MIPWWEPVLNDDAYHQIGSVIDSGYINEGPLTAKIEDKISKSLLVNHSLMCTNGTSAIFLALKSIGLSQGEKVAVPNMSFFATASAVVLAGGKPVFVDVNRSNLCIDDVAFETLMERDSITKAVLVHPSGRSCWTPRLLELNRNREVDFIEDAAEAFGSKDPITRKFLGTIGRVGAFSFSPNKIVTSGQGGALVTNDSEIARNAFSIKNQGRTSYGNGGNDNHETMGFNFRFTDLQAAILMSQMNFLQERKKFLSELYKCYLSQVPMNREKYFLPFDIESGEFPLWPEFITDKREKLINRFQDENIRFRLMWTPFTSLPPFRDDSFRSENSNFFSRSALWLPSSLTLTKENIEKVIQVVTQHIIYD